MTDLMKKKERQDIERLITRIQKLADDLRTLTDKHHEQLIIDDIDRPTKEDALEEAFHEIAADPEFARYLLDPGEDKRTWRRWTQYALDAAWPIYPELLIQALRETLKRYWARGPDHDPPRSKGQAEENAEYAHAEAVACEQIAKLFSAAAKRLEKRCAKYKAWQDEP
jgi:hypothetical protein